MRGNVTRRGKSSWRIKFDVATANGKREIKYHTVRGTKRDAEAKLAELLAAVGKGTYVEPSKLTVSEFVRGRVDQWEAAGDISARTAQRYRQLVENQIVPHLGAKLLQRLTRLDVEGWHTVLRNRGLAARTIGHANRVLSGALRDAERDGAVTKNVARLQGAPKVPEQEMVIVRDVADFVDKLRRSGPHAPAMIALFTGARLGEVLALRWSRIDLDRKTMSVREALEATKAHGVRFKAPKSRAGRRDISLPDILVDVLRDHRKAALELRMQLGAGKLPEDALLFSKLDGGPLNPGNVSSDWGELAASLDMPEITFHSLRHSHVSQLISAGVDIVTISKRLGHAKPSVTLAIYAHMFTSDDSKAAAAINATMA